MTCSKVEPRQAIIDAVRAVELALGVKSVGQIVKRYDDQLTNAVYDVWNRHSDAVDLARAHRAMLRDFAPQAFIEGMREGGIAEPDEEDLAEMSDEVATWLDGQLPHVGAFSKDTEAARDDKAARDSILARIVLWVNALRDLGAAGRAYANNNKKGTWILGRTEEHCTDCLRYSRLGPHRMSYWRKRKLPRARDLECHGFYCDCDIVDSTGASLL